MGNDEYAFPTAFSRLSELEAPPPIQDPAEFTVGWYEGLEEKAQAEKNWELHANHTRQPGEELPVSQDISRCQSDGDRDSSLR